MKRFCKKMILFAVLFCTILLLLDVLSVREPFRKWFALLTDSYDYYYSLDTVHEVKDVYLRMVREEGGYTKLVVGDSVCHQMLNDLHEVNTDYCIAGNNRALSMAGEYLLVREFLELHEGVTDVYLIVGLDFLQTEIDETFGFGYVVAPFVQEGMLDNLDEETIAEIKKKFGRAVTQKQVVDWIEYSPINRKLYLSYLRDRAMMRPYTGEVRLSDIAADYLVKTKELCEEYGAKLYLLPDPLADSESRHAQAEMLWEDFSARGLDELFPDYFEEINYYPEEQFEDDIHFGEPYNTREVLNQRLQELYLDRGYLDGLILSE